MATRVFSRPRSRRQRLWQARLEALSRGQVPQWILRLSLACLFLGLVTGLGLYRHVALQQVKAEAKATHEKQVQELETQWLFQPQVPPFERGDEPEVRRMLRDDPLVLACVRRADRRTWIRHEGRLVPATPEVPLFQETTDLVDLTYRIGRFPIIGIVVDGQDRLQGITMTLVGGTWMVVKYWPFGEESLDGYLRKVMGPSAPRVSVLPGPRRTRAILPFEDTAFQVHPSRLERSRLRWVKDSNMFGEGWSLVVVPSRELEARLLLEWHLRFAAAVLVALVIVAVTWLALVIRNRARARAVVDSDRMASLVHSLKTPLAVLRLRCDTVRFGNPDEATRNRILLRLGEEVEDLTRLIERSLDSLKGPRVSEVAEPVDEGLLLEVADEFRTLLEQEGRSLEVQCPRVLFQVEADNLETALRTLLENALLYGRGTVHLEVTPQGALAELRVRDEGSGLSQAQLATLGRPFQRFREKGNEGFGSEGQGLGFSLLAQRAAQEGWGLQVQTSPGQGFDVRLLLPATAR